MGKEDILKWVLIAGAAYLVYRYLQTQGMLGPAQSALPAAAQPGAEAVEPPAGDDETPPPPPPPPPPAEEQEPGIPFGMARSLAESVTALGYDPTKTYTGHEWNFFWTRASVFNGVEVGPAEMGLLETQKVYIEEALRRMQAYLRSSAGVAGLPLAARARFAQVWGSGWTN